MGRLVYLGVQAKAGQLLISSVNRGEEGVTNVVDFIAQKDGMSFG